MDRRRSPGLGVFSGEGGSKRITYPVQVRHTLGKHFALKLACQVVFERKGFARDMVSNCNSGATTYMVCWVGTDRGAAPAEGW